jgi:hypothetical protein
VVSSDRSPVAVVINQSCRNGREDDLASVKRYCYRNTEVRAVSELTRLDIDLADLRDLDCRSRSCQAPISHHTIRLWTSSQQCCSPQSLVTSAALRRRTVSAGPESCSRSAVRGRRICPCRHDGGEPARAGSVSRRAPDAARKDHRSCSTRTSPHRRVRVSGMPANQSPGSTRLNRPRSSRSLCSV